jgi:hypothetical protein
MAVPTINMIGPINGAIHIDGVVYRSTTGLYAIPQNFLAVAQAAGLELQTCKSAAAAPTVLNIPAGTSEVWKNTGDGTVKLYYNDGGTLKSVALA